MFYAGANSEVLIANLDRDDNIIYLCDGSKWQTRQMDIKTISFWYPGQLVQVLSSDVNKYPYVLINEDTARQERVRVRLLDVFFPGDDAWIRESGVESRLID
jgi:hypothetical protein